MVCGEGDRANQKNYRSSPKNFLGKNREIGYAKSSDGGKGIDQADG
jgi:hypothetical protein